MKYRGFNIRTVDAIDLLRYNAATDDKELCHGVYCEIYNVRSHEKVSGDKGFQYVTGGSKHTDAEPEASSDADDDTEATGDSMPMSQSNLPAGEETEVVWNQEGDIVDERIRNDIYG